MRLFGLTNALKQSRWIPLLLSFSIGSGPLAWAAPDGASGVAQYSAQQVDPACVIANFNNIAAQFAQRLEMRRTPTEKGRVVEQSTADLYELYKRAQTSKKRFDDSLRRIGKDLDVEVITADIKSFDRMQSKVNKKLLGIPTALTDVLRGTLICDTFGQIQQIKKQIALRFMDVKFFDRFETPKENGYRDLQAVVLVPSHKKGEAPIWAEIQVQLRSMYEAKKKHGDALYEQWRKIKEMGAKQDLTAEQIAEGSRLQAQEKQLYDQAFSNAR